MGTHERHADAQLTLASRRWIGETQRDERLRCDSDVVSAIV
jgi:hypothetical protein